MPDSLLPAPLLLRAGQYGMKQGVKERGRAPPEPAPAVPGLGGDRLQCSSRCEWEWESAGKMALSGFLPAFVAQFHSDSPPPRAPF